MKRLHLILKGMSCEHCVGTVKGAVDAVGGVTESRVRVNEADVQFDEGCCQPAQIIGAIRASGAFDVVSFRVEKAL